jgi:CO/xanthine dehydrogenase Mo-binding subunit
MSGAVEIGQGSATVLTQIAAEELGLPMQQVAVAQSSTVATPFERTTNGSRTTTLVGLAVQCAARNAVAELVRMAGSNWDIDPQLVHACNGAIAGPDGRSATYGEVVEAWFGADAGEAVGIGIVRPEGDTKAMPPFWEIGMVGVGLRINDETGEVRVQRLSTVGDIGFAINPAAMEGQDLGAAMQGLGAALFEELTYDGGQLTNANLVDYRVPRSTDMPPEIVTHLAERQDGIGPFGAKGGGEGSLNPVGGAAMSAVARALGVWPDEVRLPLTPERVWRLMNESES